MKTNIQNLVALLAASACPHESNRRRAPVRGSCLLRSVLALALAAVNLHVADAAVRYQVLHHFGGTLTDGTADGQDPQAGLIEGRDGKLYGTTTGGGTINGRGNVFRIDPKAAGPNYGYEVITNLPGGILGGSPRTALLQGSDDAFYGQASNGGSTGRGAVFKLKFMGGTEWTYSVIHNFTIEAAGPYGALIADQVIDGVFYGTTGGGGVYGRGAVFRLTRITDRWEFAVMYSFDFLGLDDGSQPMGLVQGSDHVLYGTTYMGGNNGQGTVFRVETNSPYSHKVLHNFASFTGDGDRLYAPLIEGSDGMLYGTAAYGGVGGGIVFRLNKGDDGSGYQVLRIFQGGGAGDGGHPWQAALVERRDGVLMGVTSAGGTFGLGSIGTIFKLNKDGSGYAVLRSFEGTKTDPDQLDDGSDPNGTLVRARDGAYYGTTRHGGANDRGTIYRVGDLGDLDANLVVDGGDFPIFNDAYRVRDTSYIQDCDFNRSLRVNLANYRTWYRFYKEAQQP